MTLNRRLSAALAAAVMLGGSALAGTPQTMTGSWVKVATAGSGSCVTVTTDDQSGATQVETSSGTPGGGDRGRIIHPFNPMSGAITADLWAKGPPGATVAVDAGLCPGGGTVASGSGSGTALQSLGLANTVATTGSAFNSAITGATPGSSVSASSNDGTALTVSGGTVSGAFGTSGFKTLSLTEALSGALNTPKTSTVTVTVSAPAANPSGGLAADLGDPLNFIILF